MTTRDPVARAKSLAPYLSLLAGLFLGRVLGQILVYFNVFTAPAGVTSWGLYLPTMARWQSGVLPYPLLVVSQCLILGLLSLIVRQFARGEGWLVVPKARLGMALLAFGTLYAGSMAVRFFLYLSHLVRDESYLGGWIPIVFHWILSAVILLMAWHHRQTNDET